MNRASSPLFYLYFRIEFQQIHPIFGISQTSMKGKPTGDRPFLVVLVPGFPLQILPEANPLNQVLITKHVQCDWGSTYENQDSSRDSKDKFVELCNNMVIFIG
jgi:hypothetical protein